MPPVPPAQSTVTSHPVSSLKVTVNVRFLEPLSPSVTLGELIDSDGLSSSVIVPVPVSVPIVPLSAPLRITTTVSSSSGSVSPVTATLKVFSVSPGSKFRPLLVIAV